MGEPMIDETSGIEYEEIFPEASRIMEGLRDTGYEFNTAIADIVDNSIAANATTISIVVAQILGGSIRVSIADNGHGMNREELVVAMRYGAPERKDIHSLGKFGLGLKTASTSCCRRLKVISRKNPADDLNCAVWDLDYIAQTGAWRLKFEKPKAQDIKELQKVAENASGTIIVWEKCDRLLSSRYSNPTTKAFRTAFENAQIALRQHLAMVFQRFLDENDLRARTVEITLNGEPILPWDPFCKELVSDLGTEQFEAIDSSTDEVLGRMTVTAYIVPASQELKTLEERQRVMPSWKNKALKAFSEDSLGGFYVYRENRLIHWGDWFNMPGIDFHHKLCRFELSIGAELDDLFQVDIKKSRILLSEEIREQLLKFSTPVKNEGNRRYRQKQTSAAQSGSTDVHAESNAVISSNESSLVDTNNIIVVGDSQVQVSNKFGVSIVSCGMANSPDSSRPAIKTSEGLPEGVLWEPAYIDGSRRGVLLNANHEFYKRFYGANKDNKAAIQAVDYIFYAIAQSEFEAYEQDAKDNLEDARFNTSKMLKKLAKQLPDVSIEDISSEE